MPIQAKSRSNHKPKSESQFWAERRPTIVSSSQNRRKKGEVSIQSSNCKLLPTDKHGSTHLWFHSSVLTNLALSLGSQPKEMAVSVYYLKLFSVFVCFFVCLQCVKTINIKTASLSLEIISLHNVQIHEIITIEIFEMRESLLL